MKRDQLSWATQRHRWLVQKSACLSALYLKIPYERLLTLKLVKFTGMNCLLKQYLAFSVSMFSAFPKVSKTCHIWRWYPWQCSEMHWWDFWISENPEQSCSTQGSKSLSLQPDENALKGVSALHTVVQSCQLKSQEQPSHIRSVYLSNAATPSPCACEQALSGLDFFFPPFLCLLWCRLTCSVF